MLLVLLPSQRYDVLLAQLVGGLGPLLVEPCCVLVQLVLLLCLENDFSERMGDVALPWRRYGRGGKGRLLGRPLLQRRGCR